MKKLCIATLLAMSASAYAGISASPLWITIQPGASSNSNIGNITVTNDDTSTAYVQANIIKVDKIGDPNSPTTSFKQGDNPKEFGLLVSPQKFAIKPNSSANIRVSNLNLNPSSDTEYTITFTPVSTTPATDITTTNNKKQKVSLDMKVIVSYQAKVFVIPKNINMKVCAKANGKSVNIHNNGNTFVQLLNGSLCDANGQNCNPFQDYNYKIIPANGSIDLQIPSTGVLNYTGKYGNKQLLEISTKNPC